MCYVNVVVLVIANNLLENRVLGAAFVATHGPNTWCGS